MRFDFFLDLSAPLSEYGSVMKIANIKPMVNTAWIWRDSTDGVRLR